MVYIPGDFWRICDRSGRKVRASQTIKQWDGLIVAREEYEDRHPQDFVRGRKDEQSVPDPRPEPIDRLLGPLTTTLTAAASAGATTLTVELTTRFEGGDDIGVFLSNGEVAPMRIDTVVSTTSLTLESGLPNSADVGALIVNYDAVAEPEIG